MNEVKKPSFIYEDNQGAIFEAMNTQVGIHTKHIDIGHPFLQDMAEEMDIDIHYIWSEENPDNITTKKNSEADFARHMRRITEGELSELVDTGRENVKKAGITDEVINHDKTEYYSHSLAEVVNGINRNK